MEVTCIDPYTFADFIINLISGAAFAVGALATVGVVFLFSRE